MVARLWGFDSLIFRHGEPTRKVRGPVASRYGVHALGFDCSTLRHSSLAQWTSARLLSGSTPVRIRQGLPFRTRQAHAAGDSPVEESPDSYTKPATRSWEVNMRYGSWFDGH